MVHEICAIHKLGAFVTLFNENVFFNATLYLPVSYLKIHEWKVVLLFGADVNIVPQLIILTPYTM